jgi:hypothetical protein
MKKYHLIIDVYENGVFIKTKYTICETLTKPKIGHKITFGNILEIITSVNED